MWRQFCGDFWTRMSLENRNGEILQDCFYFVWAWLWKGCSAHRWSVHLFNVIYSALWPLPRLLAPGLPGSTIRAGTEGMKWPIEDFLSTSGTSNNSSPLLRISLMLLPSADFLPWTQLRISVPQCLKAT